MVKVSVIVPVYNVEPYLSKCLTSLVNQKLEGIEIIVVNDASTDNSLSISLEFQKNYPDLIKVIDSKVNLKQGGARNLGIDAAEGQYIGFVDSDDWVELDMYEKLYSIAILHNADIVDTNIARRDNFEKFIKNEVSLANNLVGEIDEFKRKLLIVNGGRLVTKIIKRELLIKNNIRFLENLFYEDNEFATTLMYYPKNIYKVDEYLYNYRFNTDSTSKRKNSYHHFDRLQTSKAILLHAEDRGVYELYKEEVDYIFVAYYYVNTLVYCLTKFEPIEINKMYEVRSYIRKNFPEYRLNSYFKKSRFELKIISKLNDISPILLKYVYKCISLFRNI